MSRHLSEQTAGSQHLRKNRAVSSAPLLITAAIVGGLAGAGMSHPVRRLSPAPPPRLAHPVTLGVATGVVCTALAIREYSAIPLVAYGALAVFGVALAVTDLAERRLPTRLLMLAYSALLVLIVVDAVVLKQSGSALRSLAGFGLLVAFYLGVALLSGQLGAGDIRLAGLLGMATAWHSWTALGLATIAGLLIGAAAGAIHLASGGSRRDRIPFGPWLILGAFVALLVVPAT